jgi:acetyl-CoA acetyltransferase
VAGGLQDRAAVVGIGETEFAKTLDDDELTLACRAVVRALDDAGIAPADVDGVTCYTLQSFDEATFARTIGFGDLHFFATAGYGGGAACATIGLAAMAVASGQAEVVVAFRSRKRGARSARMWAAGPSVSDPMGSWTRP